MSRRIILSAALACALAAGVVPLRAAEAPFESRLLRLSEILGSLHYLRNLCGETSTAWRDEMQALLEAENPEPELRARFVSSFNSGYRSFAGGYTTCTESAYAAIARYMKEGEDLARDIAVRFGN
jgi:uncharacterized protein (TIGR02301 family)